MFKPSPQQCTQPNMANFKKRPLAQLITLTLSLSAYGMINNQAHAAGSPDLDCTQGSVEISSDAVTNSAPCTITSGVTIKDGGHLSNESTIDNQNELLNLSDSDSIDTSKLTNEAGATLTNSGLIANESYYGGSSNLTNSGALTNSGSTTYDSAEQTHSFGGLYNSSEYEGSTSTLTNAAGATLTNTGLMVNESYDGGTSTLTNLGTLTNSGDSYPSGYGGLYNSSEDKGSNSTLTNAAGGKIINHGFFSNISDYSGTSTLTNEAGAELTNKAYASLDNVSGLFDGSGISTISNAGTLTNNGYLTNYSVNGGTSILSNSGTLTNNGTIYNYDSIINSGVIDNSGTFMQTTGSTVVNVGPDNLGGIYGSGTVDIQGGSLSGNGTIEASQITIGENATVKPGNSPGTLVMISDDVQFLGTLQTEIVSSDVYDVLEVRGTVTLSDDSLFDFLFDDSYVETDGDSFDFLTAFDFGFGTAPDFDNWFARSNFSVTGLAAGFGWTVTNQNPNYLSLDIFLDGTVVNPDPNAVSAPGTLGLFGLSLALLGWGSRRRAKLRAHRV
jgi:hypothetical protein